MSSKKTFHQQTLDGYIECTFDTCNFFNEQTLNACTSRSATKGLVFIKMHDIDPNQPLFGTEKEPLLHALARRRKTGGIAELCRETGANIEQTNAAGETPLALALIACAPFKNAARVLKIVEEVGGDLNALPTVRQLARHCIRTDALVDLMMLNHAGMQVDPKQVPLMHLFALHGQNEFGGLYLLDKLEQDPLERDAQGRTVMELPGVMPTNLLSQLSDAMGSSPKHDMAVMMGIHKRLGAASWLQHIPVDLFRDFIIPNAVRHLKIEKVRAERLKALTANEGVTIQWSLEMDYVHMGSADVTLADFRCLHFLTVTKGLHKNLPKAIKRSKLASRDMLTDRLTESGFLFDEPYTAEYAERAKASLKAYA